MVLRNDPRSAWLDASLQFATAEAGQWRAGTEILLARLSELLFVEAVRRCIDALPAEFGMPPAGWRRRGAKGVATAPLMADPAGPGDHAPPARAG